MFEHTSKERNPLIVFFLTIDVLTEVSRICFNVADQVIICPPPKGVQIPSALAWASA